MKRTPIEADTFHTATIPIPGMAAGRHLSFLRCTVMVVVYITAFTFEQSRNPFRTAIRTAVGYQIHSGTTIENKCCQKNHKQVCQGILHGGKDKIFMLVFPNG
jgi:hypothetical protein